MMMGRGGDLLPSALASLQEALRLADQLQAVIASQTAIIHQHERLSGNLLAAMPQSPAVVHADAGRQTSWLNPDDGVILLRKSWQCGHNHDWN